MRVALGLKLAIAAAVLFATGGPTVLAQSDLRPEGLIGNQAPTFNPFGLFRRPQPPAVAQPPPRANPGPQAHPVPRGAYPGQQAYPVPRGYAGQQAYPVPRGYAGQQAYPVPRGYAGPQAYPVPRGNPGPQAYQPQQVNPFLRIFPFFQGSQNPQPDPPPPPSAYPPNPQASPYPPQQAQPRLRRPVVARPRPVIVRDTPDSPRVPPTAHVAVLGDSLGELLAQGLVEELAATRPELGVLRRAKGSSGLVRNDFYDWPKAVAELIAGSDSFSVAVMLIGSNDRQPIRDEAGQTHEPGSEAWRIAYAKRVEGIVRAFADRRVPLIWVGLPPVESPRVSADMLALNDIYRAEVQKRDGIYLDLWEPFLDEQGRFSPYGPDVNGQNARLRTGDGVHFTKAGSRKAAHFAALQIKRLLEPEPGGALLIAVPRDTPGLPEPPEPAAAPVLPVRPLAGPIVPLTQPELSVGGTLLAGLPPPASTAAGLLIERVFVEGRPTEAKPGRVDDYAWPRR